METTEVAPNIVGSSTFVCAKCNRSFKSGQALGMHKMRVHTRAGKMGARWKMRGRRNMTKSQTLAAKQAYNADRRARNIALGLTARGTPRIRAVPQKRIAAATAAVRKEQQRQRARDWYHKNKSKKRMPLMVYPDPRGKTYAQDQPDVKVEPMRGYIDFQPKFRISIEMLDAETTRKE